MRYTAVHPHTGDLTARMKSLITFGKCKHQKLVIDILAKPGELPGNQEFTRLERWTDCSRAEIYANQYKNAIGFKDSLAWSGTQVFIRISGLTCFDVQIPDNNGNLCPQDTAVTLNDWMQSSATDQFLKGMTRTRMQGMDLQRIGMIAILGVGAFLGLYMLGVI